MRTTEAQLRGHRCGDPNVYRQNRAQARPRLRLLGSEEMRGEGEWACIRTQIGLELGDVDVQLSLEANAGRHG